MYCMYCTQQQLCDTRNCLVTRTIESLFNDVSCIRASNGNRISVVVLPDSELELWLELTVEVEHSETERRL